MCLAKREKLGRLNPGHLGSLTFCLGRWCRRSGCDSSFCWWWLTISPGRRQRSPRSPSRFPNNAIGPRNLGLNKLPTICRDSSAWSLDLACPVNSVHFFEFDDGNVDGPQPSVPRRWFPSSLSSDEVSNTLRLHVLYSSIIMAKRLSNCFHYTGRLKSDSTLVFF